MIEKSEKDQFKVSLDCVSSGPHAHHIFVEGMEQKMKKKNKNAGLVLDRTALSFTPKDKNRRSPYARVEKGRTWPWD